MEARTRTIPDWFTRIRSRQLTLPRFQRYEAWSHQQVSDLIETILAGLPAGAVLTLEVAGEEPFASRVLSGAPPSGDSVNEQLLDGQQRLTALWRALHDDYPDRKFFVSFDEEDDRVGADGIGVVSFARWKKNGSVYPIWADDPAETWKRGYIPVAALRPDGTGETYADEWAEAATEGAAASLLSLSKRISKLREKVGQYNIPLLSLPATTEKEIALDVFTKMNTSATPLSAFDIVVAQVEATMERSLHELVEELHSAVPNVSHYQAPESLVLQTAALLQGQTPTRTNFLEKSFGRRLIEDWDNIVSGIRRAVTFVEDEAMFDSKRIPSDVVLYLQCALWAVAPESLDAAGEARTVLSRVLWRGVVTDRYEKTSATRALADFKALRSLKLADMRASRLFDGETHPLPEDGELLGAGWPVRKERLSRTILALSLREGGLDFADGSPVSREQILKREYHHLFPKAWLTGRDVPAYQIDRALNCALVSWRTNRDISAKQPSRYLAERMDGSAVGESEIRRRLESHLIPVEPIENDDYERFLEARIDLIQKRIEELAKV